MSDDQPARGLRLTDRRMRILGRPYRRGVLVTATLGVALTVTRVAQALLIARVLGHVLRGRGSVDGPIAVLAGLCVIRAVVVWLRDRRAAAAAAAVRAGMSIRLFNRLAVLGPGYLAGKRTGAIETVVVDGVDRLGGYYGGFVPLGVASIVSVVAVLTWVAVLDPFTAMVMAAAAVLVPLAPILTARAFGETGREFSDKLGRLGSEYLDAIQGLVTLKAFNAAPRWGHRVAEQCEELAADTNALRGLTNIHVGFVSLGIGVGTVLSVALATVRATHHSLSGSALLAILLLSRECFRPLSELQAAFPAAYDAVARANAVFDLLDAQPAAASPAEPAVIDRAKLVASVAFDEVTFSYRDDRDPALEGVSFDVAPGEVIAIVGPSGAGKTTIVSLLLRFLDPASGTIRVGGHDVRTLALTDLRSLIAVTFQDSYLFHRSVADNLLLARPSASIAEMEAAARAANAHEFIVALPDGYDTIVDERGARLSGGERQRVAIARALLADAPIVVFDEPTSSVDATSETLITETLRHLTTKRTTIIIAHRLSTVARADRVVVLDRGRVVEVGSPDELRAGTGRFARLVQAQELAP